MEKQIEQVLEFHKTFNLPINENIYIGPTPNQQMRGKAAVEEAKETLEAIGRSDLTEIADGVVDCLYVAIGTAITYGFQDKLIELFDAVHKSNMSKLGADGEPILREDGKVIKGPNYKPPTDDIISILRK